MSFDAEITIFFQKLFLSSTLGIGSAVFLARVLIFAFIPLFAWLWVYGGRFEKYAIKDALWAMGVAVLITETLSLILLRIRPFLSVAEIVCLIPPPLTSSFPSTHTAMAVAATFAVYSVNRCLGHLCTIIALGVAMGRIVTGVHYPSDVLGGMLVGIFAFAAVRLGHKALKRVKN